MGVRWAERDIDFDKFSSQQFQMQAGMKRRPSEEMGGNVDASTGLATPIGSRGVGSIRAGGASSGKKLFILAGPWDLEIPTGRLK